MAGEEPIRDLYPVVSEVIDPTYLSLFIYPFFAVVAAIFIYGVYKRYKSWFEGKGGETGIRDIKLDDLGERLMRTIRYGLLQEKVLRDVYGGIMHVLIFVGIIGLTIITGLVFIEADFLMHFDIRILTGNFYLAIEVFGEVFGLALIGGILLALYRRAVINPPKLKNTVESYALLILLLAIGIGGFLLEGMRLAYNPVEWGQYSFVGYAISRAFVAAGMGAGSEALIFPYTVMWIGHIVFAFVSIALVPYTKLFHIVSSPANIFTSELTPVGEMSKPFDAMELMESDDAEFTAGAKSAQDYNWNQRLSFDACTVCGRCQEACPAYNTDKPLSPREIVQKLKGAMHAEAVAMRIVEGEKTAQESDESDEAARAEAIKQNMVEQITDDEIWACTTCMACVRECPVLIRPMSMIAELRRHLTLVESKFPDELQGSFRNLETNYNPWAFSYTARADWREEEEVEAPVMGENPDEEYDVLFYVGCAGSFDDRVKKVSGSLVKLFNKAGVKFGILGTEEQCCGETARRLGNEFMAQMLITANVDAMKQYKFKKIVTACPHCYNTLKNEYPRFGAQYEVIHHSEFIADLIRQGKLTGIPKGAQTMTYHDSCYLGRYNDIFDQPREVLGAMGISIKEMDKHHDRSFCCGAGGGRIWLEETIGKRISSERMDQALATGTKTIATACPYCLTMFEDSRKALDREDILTQDIAEYLQQKIDGEEKKADES